MDEIRRVFGGVCTEEEMRSIIREADTNGDNAISFPEFEAMMQGLVPTSLRERAHWSIC